MLQKVKIGPGINREGTNLANEAGWWSCDKIRFRSGYPEKLGGWTTFLRATFLGVCRALINWVTLGGTDIVGIGTNLKYYVEQGYNIYDITPIRSTVTLGADPFATTNNSTDVVVTHVAHGASAGDFVTFSGASAVAGLTLNGEFEISTVVPNSYHITAPAQANATTAGGGVTVVAAYQISVGLPYAVIGSGWGAGVWGRGTWGSSSMSTTLSQMRRWSHTNFGEDLIICPGNAPIYYWAQTIASVSIARAVALSSLAGASDVPLVAYGVLVTQDRHTVAFGCNPLGSSTQDPMMVRWSDTESAVDWTPRVDNSAGGQRLVNGSAIVAFLDTRQEVLIWSDAAVISMQFVGVPYTFSFTPIATNVSIASSAAMVTAANTVYWMGQDKFYAYSGQVETLPCALRQFVFGDFNASQKQQVVAGTNEGFNEVWWFYPSANATINDRYVIYNYLERLWYYGNIERTAWLDSPLRAHPMAAATDGQLYFHENGIDDGSTNPPQALAATIESADFDLSDGDRLTFIKRVIPDLTFDGSTAVAPSAIMTIAVRNFPGSAYSKTTASPITRSVAVPVEEFTEQFWIRLRGRQVAFTISSEALGVQWQLGAPRLDLQQDGRK